MPKKGTKKDDVSKDGWILSNAYPPNSTILQEVIDGKKEKKDGNEQKNKNAKAILAQVLEAPEASCVMDPGPSLICVLPCRSLTRYALTSKEKLTKILRSFLIVGNEIGLFQNHPQQWECLAQGACLRCFIEWVPPLIRASHRLSNYTALWLVEPHPALSSTIATPGQVVQAKGEGKGCKIDPTSYHKSLKDEDKEGISTVIKEEAGRHYLTRRE